MKVMRESCFKQQEENEEVDQTTQINPDKGNWKAAQRLMVTNETIFLNN